MFRLSSGFNSLGCVSLLKLQSKRILLGSSHSEPAAPESDAPKPPQGRRTVPSPPLRKVLLIPVFDQGFKGGVGTVLCRLKLHFALLTESNFSSQSAYARAIALTTSASRHPYPLSTIRVLIESLALFRCETWQHQPTTPCGGCRGV